MSVVAREPVVSLSLVAALVIALLQGIASGDVNSFQEWLAVAIPVFAAFLQRAFVTPTSG